MKIQRWPVLTTYDQDHLEHIGLPLGGIGTGVVSLGGRGDLRNWEIVNRPAKGFKPKQAFFALYAKPADGESVTRCLEGVINPRQYRRRIRQPCAQSWLAALSAVRISGGISLRSGAAQ